MSPRRIGVEQISTLSDVEQSLLGMDHALAGRHLAEAWRLPAEVATVMEHNKNESHNGAFCRLVALARFAECYRAHVESELQITEGWEERDPEFIRIGIAVEDWRRTTSAWESQVEEVFELARLFC